MSTARRWTLRTLVSLGAAACVLAICGTQAEAATAPVIESESVENVAATSATLQAQIDPGGAATTYRFEYGAAEGSYRASVPVPDEVVGAGEESVNVNAHVQGLATDTVYHYRVVAHNELETLDGVDHSFTTQPASVASELPDRRQYELVSPVSKYGAEALGIDTQGAAAVVAQASEDGRAITYGMRIPPEREGQANPLGGVNILSTRSADGWSTNDVTPPYTEQPLLQEATSNPYRLFSPDLSSSIMQVSGAANVRGLSAEAPKDAAYGLPFMRSNSGYRPLVTGELPERMFFVFEGASPDLSHVVLRSGIQTQRSEDEQLYEWFDGKIQLVSILPGGEQAVLGGASRPLELGASNTYNVNHAISTDGSHIIFTVNNGASVSLYERNMATEKTVQVGEGSEEEFQTASSDGLKVFSTDTVGSNLYEYDVEAHKMSNLALGGGVQGVLGANEDGSSVYFVGTGILKDADGRVLRNGEGREPAAGANNLYLAQEARGGWSPKFIVTLSERDHPDWAADRPGFGLPYQTSRVSPNGRFVAFMSEASLTGYDNVDVKSGQRDVEVYLYDAASGRLRCVSCNPTGARPVGEPEVGGSAEFLAMDPNGSWLNATLAAAVPGWTEANFGPSAYYQSRYLSDGGRLFFDSADALVPQDTNDKEDVYEYEPEGIGSCSLSSGCVGLISGGNGGQDSSFVDASANGNDVFFRTADRLVPQDVDNAYDVYDAHVCSIEAPCLPPPIAGIPPCASSDACKPGPVPQPAVLGPPASATFSGSGNIIPLVAAPTAKAKSKGRKLAKRNRKHRRKTKRSGSHSKRGGR